MIAESDGNFVQSLNKNATDHPNCQSLPPQEPLVQAPGDHR